MGTDTKPAEATCRIRSGRPLSGDRKWTLLDMNLSKVFTMFALIAGSLSVGSVHAQQWELRKGIVMSAGVVTAQSDGVDDFDNDVTSNSTNRTITLAPFVAASRKSRRLSINGRAGFTYRGSSTGDNARVDPNLSFQMTGALVDDSLWLDTDGNVSRRLIGPKTIVDDADTNPDAAIDVYEFSIGPRWEKNLSSTLKLGAAYRFGLIEGDSQGAVGSDAHLINLVLLNSFGDGQAQAGLRLNAQRTDFDAGGNATSQSLVAGLSYAFKSNLIGRLSVGADRLDSSSQDALTPDLDEQGAVFGVGMNWRPSRHVFIDAEYQERAFGSKPTVTIGLEGRASTLEFSFSREASIASDFGFSDSVLFGGIGTGEFFGDVSTQSIRPDTSDLVASADPTQTTTPATFASEVQNVNDVFALRYRLRGRVSEFQASVTHVEQRQLLSSEECIVTKVQLSYSRSVRRGLQLAFSVSATDGHTTLANGDVTDRQSQEARVTLRLAI